ncbi:MAG: YraN family protein [Chloroflexota bacterium]|nr:YraN family protein [Chloroflexota bacterium]
MMTTRAKGMVNEQRAASYLRAHGYAIMALNWRCKVGEIDIIARHDETVVFVEVRSRRTTDAAFESVNARKQARLIRAAQWWLSENRLDDCAWRIDVIAVGTANGKLILQHREDALDW